MMTIGAFSWVLISPIGLPDCTISVSPSNMVRSVSTILSCDGQSRAALPTRGVDHEVRRIFTDCQHVLEKAQQPLLPPSRQRRFDPDVTVKRLSMTIQPSA